jgi:hypothetical protein
MNEEMEYEFYRDRKSKKSVFGVSTESKGMRRDGMVKDSLPLLIDRIAQ